MKRSGDKRIALWLVILFLAACSSPKPSPVTTLVLPLKTIRPILPSPTAGPIGPWQVWLVNDQSAAIYAIVVDGDRLWLGTSNGVLRYDPQTDAVDHFQAIGATSRLFLTPEGNVWAVGESGLYYFDGQRWFKPAFNAEFQVLANHTYQFGIDRNGDLHLAAGVSRGVRSAHFSGHVPPTEREWTELVNVTPAPPVPYGCSGWQMMTTINRAYRSLEECEKELAAEETIKGLTFSYPNIVIDGDGSAWWTAGDTLNHLVNGTSQVVPLSTGMIYALAADAAHGVWLGTDRGLLYYSEQQTTQRTPRLVDGGLPAPVVDITFNARGTPFINGGGLYTLRDGEKKWTRINDDPIHNTISPTIDVDGGIWLTSGHDLQKLGGERLNPLTVPHSCVVTPPNVDVKGNAWSIGFDCGLPPNDRSSVIQYNADRKWWIPYELYTPERDVIRALTLDVDGTPYILGAHGVYSRSAVVLPDELIPSQNSNIYQPITSWQPITTINQALSQVVTMPDGFIAADQKHGLWIASRFSGEVWHYAADQITPFGPHLSPNTLTSLHVDNTDRLWLLGQSALVMFDNQTWRNIDVPNLGYLSRVTSAPDGRVWIVGQHGLAVYDPARDDQP